MADKKGHEFYKQTFLTMRKGEIVWIKLDQKNHGNIFHTFCKKEHLLAEQQLGPDIFIRLHLDYIKRAPIQKDSKTFGGKMEYFETIREVCKELVAEGSEKELANAQ